VEVSSPEVYGSVYEEVAQKKYGIWKYRGVITGPLGCSRVNIRWKMIPGIDASIENDEDLIYICM